MSIRKEDLHSLVDLVNEKDAKLVYDLIKVVIEKDAKLVYDLIKVVIEKDHEKEIIVEADNSPLTKQEKKLLKQVKMDIKNDDLIDWEDLRGLC
ncbi:hypothetical protein ACIQD3_02570 [Peribacillus loiseleuriae]|uniref:hypothetical protein n=1 Tax=Peribacillus loiseleuriae TaxID=1679170 RepID=UPI0037F1FDD7